MLTWRVVVKEIEEGDVSTGADEPCGFVLLTASRFARALGVVQGVNANVFLTFPKMPDALVMPAFASAVEGCVGEGGMDCRVVYVKSWRGDVGCKRKRQARVSEVALRCNDADIDKQNTDCRGSSQVLNWTAGVGRWNPHD